MKAAYPIVMTEGKEYIIVGVPDFNINTQGIDYVEAIEMARDAIGIMGIDMEDENEAIPKPSSLSVVKNELEEGAIVSFVDVDFSEYRRKHEMRTVKRTVSLPSWLNVEAEKAGINVSAVLQAALKDELNLGH